MATTAQRDRHARRRQEADAQLLVSIALRAAVELALALALRPALGQRPALDALLLTGRLLAGELAVHALVRRRH